jgi:hypothetical protein
MKWKNKKQKEMFDNFTNDGDKTKKKFLFLPVTLQGETRWLEYAYIKYISWPRFRWIGTRFSWLPISWSAELEHDLQGEI